MFHFCTHAGISIAEGMLVGLRYGKYSPALTYARDRDHGRVFIFKIDIHDCALLS